MKHRNLRPKVDLSVIVPAAGSVFASRVGACLAAIAAQHDCRLEIVLVQTKADPLPHGLEKLKGLCRRVLVASANRARPSFMRNEGVFKSRGRYLLFCDADILLPSGFCARALRWLAQNSATVLTCPFRDRILDEDQQRLIAAVINGEHLDQYLVRHEGSWFRSSNADMCEPLIRGTRHGFPTYATAKELLATEPELSETCYRGELWGGCLIVDRRLFDEVGGYCEQYSGWGYEDADLKAKLSRVAEIRSMSSLPELCDLRVHHLEHPMPHKTAATYGANARLWSRRKTSSLEGLVLSDLESGQSRYFRARERAQLSNVSARESG